MFTNKNHVDKESAEGAQQITNYGLSKITQWIYKIR